MISSAQRPPRIAMLSTGEEVLFGDIVDTNASWLSSTLFDAGFSMTTRVTVGDSTEAISSQITALSQYHDVVIVNGGLGPTSDDLTAEAAARSADVSLSLNPAWVERLQVMYERWQRPMPESNLKQAMLPSGSGLLDNPNGTACGFHLTINNAECYFTPGVPHEFKAMVMEQVLPHMRQLHPYTRAKQVHRIFTFGLSESGIAGQLEQLECPEQVTLGYRSSLPFIEVKIFYQEPDDQVSHFLSLVEQELEGNTVSINQSMVDRVEELVAATNRELVFLDGVTQGYLQHWFNRRTALHPINVNGTGFSRQSDEIVENDPQSMVRTFEQLAQDYSVPVDAITLLVTESELGRVTVSLKSAGKIFSQKLGFKRNYQRQSRSVVVAAIALDLLRRHLSQKPIFAAYGNVTRYTELTVQCD